MPIFQESGHVPSVTTGWNISSAGGPAPGGPPPLPPARGFSAGGSVHLGSGQLLQQPWSGSHPGKGTAHFTSAEPRRGAGHQVGPPWQQPRVWMSLGLARVGLGGTEPRRPTGCVSGCTRPGVCFGSCGLALLGLQGRAESPNRAFISGDGLAATVRATFNVDGQSGGHGNPRAPANLPGEPGTPPAARLAPGHSVGPRQAAAGSRGDSRDEELTFRAI